VPDARWVTCIIAERAAAIQETCL